MLKTIELSKISALKAFRVYNDEIVGIGNVKTNETDKTLAKFKFIKKFAKVRLLEEPIFLSFKANTVFFMKNDLN